MTEASLSGQEVFDRLLGEIEREELRSGARMRESSIAAKYGVSRTPVREALKRMQAIGLLAHAPHRGMIVLEQDATRRRDLKLMREALVCAAARQAALEASPEDIDLLRDAVREIKQIRPEMRRKIRALARIEQALCEVVANPSLTETIRQTGLKHQISGKPCELQAETWPVLTDLLNDLVQNIAARMPDEAEKSVRAFIRFEAS